MSTLTKTRQGPLSFSSFCKTFGYSGSNQFSAWQKKNPGLNWKPGDDWWSATPIFNGSECTGIIEFGTVYTLNFKDGTVLTLSLTEGDNIDVQHGVTDTVAGILPR